MNDVVLDMNFPKVTRFEVIDEQGRVLTKYGVSVYIDLQDDNRTMKVFIHNSDNNK